MNLDQNSWAGHVGFRGSTNRFVVHIQPFDPGLVDVFEILGNVLDPNAGRQQVGFGRPSLLQEVVNFLENAFGLAVCCVLIVK